MDKREQIARMAQNKDDEILLAKLYERMTTAQARNIPAVSGFLSKREQMLAQELLRGQEICFFGGPELAEREICCYLPDYLDSSWLTGDDGPIAAVRDGDMIEIDIDKHTIHLEVSDEELAERLGHIKRPAHPAPGVLGAYRKAVDSVNEGCTWLYGKEE